MRRCGSNIGYECSNAASAPRVAAVVPVALQSGVGSSARGGSRGTANSRRSVGQPVVRRIQRSRERGSRQPTNAKDCGRPTEWGNPFPIGEEYTRTEALEAFRKAFWANELPVTPAKARTELAAYDYLSCWCRLDQPCHVDEYIRAIFCEHNLRDVDGRSCPVCRACLHKDIAIDGPRATCRDCGKTFVGW